MSVLLPPPALNALPANPALVLTPQDTAPLFGPGPAVSGAPVEEPATDQAEPVSEELVPVAFLTHQVVEGDTLSAIAAQYGVDVQYLIWNNPETGADPDALIAGEELVVPGTNGIIYDVRLGDTITDIAATYAVDPAEVVAFAPNNLESADVIVEGMRLVVPGGVPPPPPPPPAPEETPVPETPAPTEPPTPPPTALPAPAPAPPPPVVTPVPRSPAPAVAAPTAGFIWPVSGRVNSGFGPRWGSFHEGIDIGAGSGTAVAAAASGQVILAVWGNYGYGSYVIVRHADGSETLYAHLSSIYVSVRQQVGQGEAIGAVGCTGWCTGPHLHFEIRIGGGPVNPLLYLP